MQHDLVAAAVGFFGDLAGNGVKGKEGKSERVREGEDRVRRRAISAEIVENDGEPRSACAGVGPRMRSGVFPGRIASFGTEIPRRFGIVTSGEASEYSKQKKRDGEPRVFSRARKEEGHERTKRLSSPDS